MFRIGWIPRSLAVCAFLIVFGSVRTDAATWHAAPGATGSGTRPADPGDLETVVESRSVSGDTVKLAAGTYTVPTSGVRVDHPLFIRGAGIGSTFLDCTAAAYCMDIDSTSITKSNMILSDLTFRDGMYYQVNIEHGSPTIKNTEFTGTLSVTSVVSRSGHPVIMGSTFTANTIGFTAHDGSEPELIAGCTFSGSPTYGIYLESAASGEIARNTFQSAYIGIYLLAIPTIFGGMRSAVSVHHNTFSANSAGMWVIANSGATGENTIKQNSFLKNGYGILSNAYGGTENSIIDANRFDGQSANALYMYDTAHVITNNLFTSSLVDAIASLRGTNSIAFNTVANSMADGISSENSDASLIANNISYRNAGYGITVDASSAAARLGGNDNFTNASGPIAGVFVDLGGNVVVNPRFLSTTNFDLRAGSPLIDAASGAYSVGFDFTGAVRIRPDIGAYEH